MATEAQDLKNAGLLSFWDQLTYPRPYILATLIVVGIILEISMHYLTDYSAGYTHFFYLIIVLAGLWYQKKALWIALFFSALYLAAEFLPPVNLSLDSVFRALMLCLVAYIIGSISARIVVLQNRLGAQYILLQESHMALETGNKKLNMLSSVTRHDVLNQLLALRGFLALSKARERDPVILDYMAKEDEAAQAIENQITFTRFYQDIGVQAPAWQDVEGLIRPSIAELRITDIAVEITFSGLEIYADPLIKKVFYNLMENSLRHGGQVSRFRFSFQKSDQGGVIAYTDDGIGISIENKQHIFKRGFGKHTGFGLFLTREILSITSITIEETGEPGKGVRFEIHIPSDKFRVQTG